MARAKGARLPRRPLRSLSPLSPLRPRRRAPRARPGTPPAAAGRPVFGLRLRIVGLVAAAICATAVAVGVLVHHAFRARGLDQARDAAGTTLDRAAAGYSRTGDVTGTGARLDAPGLPAGLRALVRAGHRGTEPATGTDAPAMWAARPVRGGRVLSVRVDMRSADDDLRALDASIVLAGLLTTAVVLPLGALTAAGMSRRLRDAVRTARRIAAGDLDARIVAPARPRDEIAEIAGAVDSMAAALQGRLHGEQRFTADVAHELRTPLMGLVTAAELLDEGEAAGYVRDRVRVLSTLVGDLLEISRLDAGAEQADLSLCPAGPLVADTVARLPHPVRLAGTAAAGGTDGPDGTGATGGVDGSGGTGGSGGAGGTGSTGGAQGPEGADGALVWTDPRRLERVLANLVANAHQHGRPPVEVAVRATPGTVAVTVRDHGAGYPAELLAEGPQRFRTGTPERGRGQGLGLTIALGQARVAGARLEFGRAPGGGALATLHLPRHRGDTP